MFSIMLRPIFCHLVKSLHFPKHVLLSPFCSNKSFENTFGKGEIARNEQFLLFHGVFNPFDELSAIFIKFEIVVSKLSRFGRVYKLSFGKGLRPNFMI